MTGKDARASFFDAVPSIPAMAVAWDYLRKYNGSTGKGTSLTDSSAHLQLPELLYDLQKRKGT